MSIQNTSSQRTEALVQSQRTFFSSGKTLDVNWRKQQLKAFRDGLKKWEKPLCDALRTDLNKCYEEAYMTEIGLVYAEIADALKHVGRWARRRRRPTPLTGLPSSGYIVREPLGCALIACPWYVSDFVTLVITPLSKSTSI